MSSSDHNSPEFEFWRVTDRSSTELNVNLVSADELFHDGILLPLHSLNLKSDPNPPPNGSDPPVVLIPELESKPGLLQETASKRWSDFFRKSENRKSRKENKKREKKTGSGSSGAAELKINIWPFSRSRSAGRPRTSSGALITRKISSAPCSRSNSAGESKSRNWPKSPVRGGGVHLGRSSPVWQVRRGDPTGKSMLGRGGEVRRSKTVNEDCKPKILNLNVPVRTGYRSRLSCRSDESNVTAASSNSRFGFRNLFIKKVQ